MKFLVTKSTGSWYSVQSKDGVKLDARLRGKFKLENKKITNPIAVGDWVDVEEIENSHVITKVYDRKNYVIRSSPRKKEHSHLIAANVDQAAVIVSQKMPRTSLGFIDRFFVTLETFRIPGLLIINKRDLYSKEEIEGLKEIIKVYEKLDYRCILISVEQDDLDEIKQWFEGKITLLSGHSGTGKSTLINKIIPAVDQAVGEISKLTGKGMHVTTFAELFSMNGNSHIIDTPGIKELGLAEIYREELSHYFPEMRPFLGKCKYHNCVHVDEPGCLIQEAVRSGDIALSRFKSYLSMLEDDDNRR